jgi:hypothetical protein
MAFASDGYLAHPGAASGRRMQASLVGTGVARKHQRLYIVSDVLSTNCTQRDNDI